MPHRPILATVLAMLATSAAAGVAPSFDAGIDLSFANDGWRRMYDYNKGTGDEKGVGFARTADGGYVVVAELPGGGASGGNGKRIGLFRLDRNGFYVGSGFGHLGRVIKDAWLTSVTAMTLDAQGRIVVVGGTPGQGADDFGIVRFNPDGSDDTSFAGDGGTRFSFEVNSMPYVETPRSVVTDPDGRIVVAGDIDIGGNRRFGVVRFNPDGSIDPAFGIIGNGAGGRRGTMSEFATGEPAYAARVLRMAGGYYVVAGTTVPSATNTDFAARILTPSGGIWPGPSGSARFAIDEPGPAGSLYDTLDDAVPVDPYTILLVGSASGRCAATRIKLGNNARLAGGMPAPSGGTVYDNLAWDGTFVGSAIAGRPNRFVGATANADCRSAAVRADGRILLVGIAPNGVGSQRGGLVTRLAANGVLDEAFGYGGSFAVSAPGGTGSSFHTTFGYALCDGAKAVLVGSSVDDSASLNDYDAIITRLNSDAIFADGFDPR